MAAKLRNLLSGLLTIVGESSWVLLCFFLVAGVVFALVSEAIPGVSGFFDTSLGQLLGGGLIYALVVAVVILPTLLRRGWPKVIRLLGMDKKPKLSILWLPFLAWIVYMSVTIIVNLLAGPLLYLFGVDPDQTQDVGFSDISQPIEYVAAFLALVILPPIAEELLFRGYLFGRLREKFGFWLTTSVVSILFGIVHMQWNVGIDVAVLSVFLCYLRERTGSIWASIVLHGIKNGLAYFLLFIGPLIGLQLV